MTVARPLSPELLALAHLLAEASAPIVRRYFRKPLTVDIKDDLSPVTRVDREVEASLRDIIARERPEDGFVGEESGTVLGKSGLTWVIDPIDGTKAFVCGKPLFGTLIALLEGDAPIMGVIDQPVTGERWLGAQGHATTMNGNKVRTRRVEELSTARIGSTSPGLFSGQDAAAFQSLSEECSIVTWGGDCYNYALVASGTLDLVAETQLKLYDYAALIPVIEGAGGLVTGWSGEAPGAGHDGRILAAATPALHRAALAMLGSAV